MAIFLAVLSSILALTSNDSIDLSERKAGRLILSTVIVVDTTTTSVAQPSGCYPLYALARLLRELKKL